MKKNGIQSKLNTISKGGTSNDAKIIKKEQIKPKTGFTEFPSSKLTSIKTIDPFSEKKGNSFAHLYSSGAIPCKIQHGSVSMRINYLQYTLLQEELPYNPLLATCFDGLTQEKHPYGFIAFHASKDMIQDEESTGQLIELLPKLIWPLRTALSNKNEKVSENAMQILKLLSDKVGSHLNSNIKNLITPIKRHMDNKKLKEKALITLRSLEDNGGPQVNKIIKAAIPTYSNN